MPVTKLRPGFCRIVSRDVSHVIDTSKEINTIRVKARVVSKKKTFSTVLFVWGFLKCPSSKLSGPVMFSTKISDPAGPQTAPPAARLPLMPF